MSSIPRRLAANILIAILLVAGCVVSRAQTNVHFMTLQAAGASCDPSWVIGSGRHRFGLEQSAYWEDSAGRGAVAQPARRVLGQNFDGRAPEVHRTFTAVYLFGQVSFCVPMPKEPVALIGLMVLAVVVYWASMAARH